MKQNTLIILIASLALYLGGCLADDVALGDDCVSACESGQERGCSDLPLDCNAVCERQDEIDCTNEYVIMMECLDDEFEACGVRPTACEMENEAYKACLAPHISQPGG